MDDKGRTTPGRLGPMIALLVAAAHLATHPYRRHAASLTPLEITRISREPDGSYRSEKVR